MRPIGPGLEFRMELHADKPGMGGQFHNLHKALTRGETHQTQAKRCQLIAVPVVELVAVTMPLIYQLQIGRASWRERVLI